MAYAAAPFVRIMEVNAQNNGHVMLQYVIKYLFSHAGRFRRRDWHFVIWSTVLLHLTTFFLFMRAQLASGDFVIYADHLPMPAGGAARAPDVQPVSEELDFVIRLFAGWEMDGAAITLFAIWLGGIALCAVATIKRLQDLGLPAWRSAILFLPTPFVLLSLLFLFLSLFFSGSLLTFHSVVVGGYLLVALFFFGQLGFFPGEAAANKYDRPRDPAAPPSPRHLLTAIGVLALAMLVSGCMAAVVYWTKVAENADRLTPP